MNKKELKEMLRPIVLECVQESMREIILESGLLSAVIKEVMVATQPTILERKQPVIKAPLRQPIVSEGLKLAQREKNELIEEMRRESEKMSLKVGGVDVFAGIKPAPAEVINEGVGSPLAGTDPGDPGVDISRLFGNRKFKP